MKHHIMIALGLLMLVLFAWLLANALIAPGLGLAEAYYAGGLVIGAFLLQGGWREWRAAKKPGGKV